MIICKIQTNGNRVMFYIARGYKELYHNNYLRCDIGSYRKKGNTIAYFTCESLPVCSGFHLSKKKTVLIGDIVQMSFHNQIHFLRGMLKEVGIYEVH